jgi:hypothetical protein
MTNNLEQVDDDVVLITSHHIQKLDKFNVKPKIIIPQIQNDHF